MSLILGASTILENPVFQGKSPTLFEDYSGRPFNGEGGGLAVNDNHATTVYDYIPQPENVPTISAFTLESGAADETIVTTRAELASALNNATFNRIYCQRGDLTDGSDNDSMTLTISGSGGNERQFLYYDPGNPSQDIRLLAPWNQAQADRVNMPRILHDVGSFTWWVGLSWGEIGTQLMRCARFDNGSSNNLHYRCNMENSTSHCWNVNSATADGNQAFECVNHEHQDGTTDVHAFIINAGINTKVVSCEGWDILGDFFQIGNGVVNEAVLEDCCIYRETFYDGAGNIDSGGDFGKGEGGADLKNLNPDGTSRFRMYGNRIWGMRQVDTVAHAGGGSGAPIKFSNNTVSKNGLDARWNIAVDCSDGCWNISGGDFGGGDHSLVRNIASDIRGTASDPVFFVPPDTTEQYLNTSTDCLSATAMNKYFRSSGTVDEHDSIGNFIQDCPADQDLATQGTNFKKGYNAYAGTFTVDNVVYGNDFEAASKAALNMGNFTFIRKKLTNPENFTINGVVPTSSTPSGFTSLVNTTGGVGNDQIGSRTGIGVDDLF